MARTGIHLGEIIGFVESIREARTLVQSDRLSKVGSWNSRSHASQPEFFPGVGTGEVFDDIKGVACFVVNDWTD